MADIFRKEAIRIYKHYALTLSDISVNHKIVTNYEKCRHLLRMSRT